MKRLLALIGLTLALLAPATLALTPVAAASLPLQNVADGTPQQLICGGIGATNPDGTCTGGDTKVSGVLSTIINLLTVVIGIVAVIMIIIGGLKFITSGGDSSKVGSAKNTIIYALIGLVVVVLAQGIVHFVLSKL